MTAISIPNTDNCDGHLSGLSANNAVLCVITPKTPFVRDQMPVGALNKIAATHSSPHRGEPGVTRSRVLPKCRITSTTQRATKFP